MTRHHMKQLLKIYKALGIEAIQDKLSLRLLNEVDSTLRTVDEGTLLKCHTTKTYLAVHVLQGASLAHLLVLKGFQSNLKSLLHKAYVNWQNSA